MGSLTPDTFEASVFSSLSCSLEKCDSNKIKPASTVEETTGGLRLLDVRAVDACSYTCPCLCLPVSLHSEGGCTHPYF